MSFFTSTTKPPPTPTIPSLAPTETAPAGAPKTTDIGTTIGSVLGPFFTLCVLGWTIYAARKERRRQEVGLAAANRRLRRLERKKQEAANTVEQGEENRGRRTSQQPATSAINRSHSSLDDHSLVTVDSDADSPADSRPTLKNRQSHMGYLTASSPLVKTTPMPDPTLTTTPPTPTEGRTVMTPSLPGPGLFSSFVSAAQNAANTFSNTISNNPPRPRSSQDTQDDGNPTMDVSASNIDSVPAEKKPSAIDTLGSGDLSLSHLGITAETPPIQRVPGSGNVDPEVYYREDESEPGTGFKRSTSVRSKIGAVTHRKRTSSAATAGTNTTIAAQKLSGFTVANKKRNRDFHQLFRSVPEDDCLIEDYSCALQREIILAGRIYVSEKHVCFSSNILGWVTTLIISFDEVVSVEKENTAMIIPNALAIQTLHARHTFRSLLSREATYDLIVGLWKLIHPNLTSTLNGAKLDPGATGDKTVKSDLRGSEHNSEKSSEEEDVDSEEEDDEEASRSLIDAADGEALSPEVGETLQKSASRKASAMGVSIGQAAGAMPTASDEKAGEKAAAAASAASADFPGPTTHPATECGDSDTHYGTLLQDDIIPAPLGKVYSMTFGSASGGFMSKWLLEEMKVIDLQMEDDKKGLSEVNKSRSYSYIKPLYASIGPKSTKCLVTESLDAMDLEKAISVTLSTQTPDVPSGNVFVVKTRCCLMWAANNWTRVHMSCTIEWSGKSWLKGPIEKGANDGQTTHANDLVKALKAGVTSRPRAGTVGSKLKGKGKRTKGGLDVAKKAEKEKVSAQPRADSWGLLKPLHGLLGPILDIFKPFISANMVIGFLLLFIVVSRLPGPGKQGRSAERIAAYEEIWREEESALWEWVETRTKRHADAAGYF